LQELQHPMISSREVFLFARLVCESRPIMPEPFSAVTPAPTFCRQGYDATYG
jgi:hypothetical protein